MSTIFSNKPKVTVFTKLHPFLCDACVVAASGIVCLQSFHLTRSYLQNKENKQSGIKFSHEQKKKRMPVKQIMENPLKLFFQRFSATAH